jgi:hypothetical protein
MVFDERILFKSLAVRLFGSIPVFEELLAHAVNLVPNNYRKQHLLFVAIHQAATFPPVFSGSSLILLDIINRFKFDPEAWSTVRFAYRNIATITPLDATIAKEYVTIGNEIFEDVEIQLGDYFGLFNVLGHRDIVSDPELFQRTLKLTDKFREAVDIRLRGVFALILFRLTMIRESMGSTSEENAHARELLELLDEDVGEL